jgi:hypothetical protein
MPAISVRDIEVKDDSTCLCSDLVAGTHGRGFWILDDVTPLRQAAAARAAGEAHAAYLFKPATAVRLRTATNDPTPWPPELPAGENPPPGAILDYYLAANASAPVTLEIVDVAGKVVRSYSSNDTLLNPDPARDPAAYNALCQRTPNAAHCGVPLYWAAPSVAMSASAGMHRFTWDLRHDPITPGAEQSTGAVPHRIFSMADAPWAAPGRYTVRLTVDGKQYTQPLTLRMDPRVKLAPLAIAQLATLSREMYTGARTAHDTQLKARALADQLARLDGPAAAALKARLDSLAPPATTGGRGGRGGGGGGGRGRGGAATAAPTLAGVSNALLAAAMAMQAADVAPTATQVAACARARAQLAEVMARWTAIKSAGEALTSKK